MDGELTSRMPLDSAPPKKRTELTQRVLVALVAIPIVVAVAYVGGWALGILLALFAAGGALELCRIARGTGARPFDMTAAVAAAATVIAATAYPDPTRAAPIWSLLLIAVTLGALGAAIFKRGPARRPLASTGATLLAVTLCGVTLAYAVFLRHMLPDGIDDWNMVASRDGPTRILFDRAVANSVDFRPAIGLTLLGFPLLVTWINDSAAYFAGRAWGKRKLIPSVSPGKTVVGAAAGFGASVLLGALLAELVLGSRFGLPIGWLGGSICAALVSVAAQIGDLAESLLKREAGVKDSGAFFPGHGGILDRLDALLFAFPVGYWSLLIALVPESFFR